MVLFEWCWAAFERKRKAEEEKIITEILFDAGSGVKTSYRS